MRFITITELEHQTLMEGYKNHPSHSVRRRFHGLLLSSQGKPVKEIASIFGVRTRTIYDWMNKWETQGVAGILTKPGQGRPSILSVKDSTIVDLVKKNSTACAQSSKNL